MNPLTVKNHVTSQVIMLVTWQVIFLYSGAEYMRAGVHSRISVDVCTCSGVNVYTCAVVLCALALA